MATRRNTPQVAPVTGRNGTSKAPAQEQPSGPAPFNYDAQSEEFKQANPQNTQTANTPHVAPPGGAPGSLQAFSDTWMQGTLEPLTRDINNYRGGLRQDADDAMSGAFSGRREDLMTPEQIAADAERRSRIDQGTLDPYREQRSIANAEMKGLLDRIYSTPSVQALSPEERRALAAEYEDRAMQQQLSVGRSAGSLAGIQQGIEGAMEQAPQLAQAAQSSARAEASSILADRNAQFRSELDRYAQASGVTQQLGGMANQAFGDESQLAVQQAQIGLGVSQELARMTGVELELDQRQRENLGRLASDLESLDLQAMNLTQQAQQQFMDAIVKMYGIDQATYAAIRAASISNGSSALQTFATIANVVATVGGVVAGAVVGGPAGAAAGGAGGAALGGAIQNAAG